MEAVREFEEHAMASGHQSLVKVVKEAVKYAQELNITLQLDSLNPVCVTTEGKGGDCSKSWESVEAISREAVLAMARKVIPSR